MGNTDEAGTVGGNYNGNWRPESDVLGLLKKGNDIIKIGSRRVIKVIVCKIHWLERKDHLEFQFRCGKKWDILALTGDWWRQRGKAKNIGMQERLLMEIGKLGREAIPYLHRWWRISLVVNILTLKVVTQSWDGKIHWDDKDKKVSQRSELATQILWPSLTDVCGRNLQWREIRLQGKTIREL